MSETLDVLLGARRIGTITLLPGDLSFFVFDDAYADSARPVLSQSYSMASGVLLP